VTAKPKPKHPAAATLRHHLDRRAGQLLASITTSPTTADQLLNTKQVAALLGVSEQWLEAGRSKGYGPPFVRLGPRCIRYPRDELVKWIKARSTKVRGA
jgi:predicted DNA-binding transcriptional regulator AlpA